MKTPQPLQLDEEKQSSKNACCEKHEWEEPAKEKQVQGIRLMLREFA